MRNFIWSLLLFTLAVFTSFSQTKGIEKGTYLSNNKGQKIKLNLLDDNKYELVFYSGEYAIKGDSLLFIKNTPSGNSFDLAFKIDKKAKNIKVNFVDPSYYSFYVGTQKGKEEVKYQRLTDIRSKQDPEWVKNNLEFEIEKTDFLYLVYEEYDGKSDVYKYELPKDVSEVTITYELAVLGDLKISGFFDKNANELRISEKSGVNPLVFTNEKDPQPVKKTSKVIPLESKSVSNWTYPGKETSSYDYGAGVVVDSVATATDLTIAPPAYNQYNFKLKIESNLNKAISETKKSNTTKFLGVYVDSKKNAKESFDFFVKDQETQTGYSMYDGYNPIYDVFNYYLAGADDKKWLKNNAIANNPSVVVVNGQGNILAIAKSDLETQKYQFNYYGDFYRKLLRANAFVSLNNALKNKKASDADLINAFNKAAALESAYDYDAEYSVDASNSTEFVITKTALDKKEVSQAWKKLIEAHQKDKQVNMYLAETIVKEIKNLGFTKQLFNEDKILNDTDFLAIDYLLKHSEEIENNRTAFNSKQGEIHALNNAVSEVSNALQQNLYASQDGLTGDVNKDKINSVYKKIIASGKGNFDAYRNYFYYLSQLQENDGSNTTYLKEFNTYFDSALAGGSPIEKLDAMFSGLDSSSSYSYDGWNSFKEYHSSTANSAAWTVVENPMNANYLKDAIKWSEYSLAVTKNNPYYLDTLAQLYYKDGQKQKAIETQALAVKYLDASTDEVTAQEIKEVLTKMQNGTY
ncbi:CDC27 family protein [Flavobacterium chungbukense]|uniref:Uncharacterized protein n=1 Tax=Flavobacterium chungbukense TaxID=877464 RepID=A0ABP7Y6W8_9FLAO|nr:CDC27 family protein [Flavobacterium chungbukense]MCC4922675.1 CDC27 family protein [Flavobacterium chungbukense]